MKNSNKVPDFLKMAADIKRKASRYAATEAEKFFRNSFDMGGFTDVSFRAWKKSAPPMAGYRTLYKGGDLQRSIIKKVETDQLVVIESALPYSELHNKGGYITVTAQMNRFWWVMFAIHGKVPKVNGKYQWSRAQMNPKSKFCKAMAMKRVGSKIKIEQRQFMGESKYLMSSFEKWFGGQVEVVFKDNLNSK